MQRKQKRKDSGTSIWDKPWALVGIAALVVLGIIFAATRGDNSASLVESIEPGDGVLAIDPAEGTIDMGTVSMKNGIVTQSLLLRNEGTGPLTIRNLTTSCMCTTAQLEVSGKKSPKFGMPGHGGPSSRGWSMEVPAGEEGTLWVYFDPNAHGPAGVGPFERIIAFATNDPSHANVELMTSGVVVQ